LRESYGNDAGFADVRKTAMMVDTIAAIATPTGRGGIGIVRISGSRAFAIALSLFRSRRIAGRSFDPDRIISHHLYYGTIINPDTQAVLDEVLIAFMKAPHSYTREDVVEIQAHSGYAVLNAILSAVLQAGARAAGPGEFTRRAFLSGRIDLTQAEAVIDIINSKTDAALAVASDHLSGGFRDHVERISAGLQDVLARIEAAIDFPDEADDFQPLSVIPFLETGALAPIQTLIRRHADGRVMRDGYRITIVGRPNVGKSSLMNWLVGSERSIVTDIPGTTRDVVADAVVFRGIPVNFFDTAGVHITQDTVELLGIEKTYDRIRTSDLILLVMDASCTDVGLENGLLEQTQGIPVIRVINKIDLAPNHDNSVGESGLASLPVVAVSVKNRLNLEALAELLAREILKRIPAQAPAGPIPNLRQSAALEDAAACITLALEGIRLKNPAELIAMDIRDALDRIEEITGMRTSEEILDRIFDSFCIGK
jgi:tRNA modification GTPase